MNPNRALRATAGAFRKLITAIRTCKLPGGCGEPVKFQGPSFFKISNDYFADEAPRSFAVEAVVFSALILTAILPIVNSAQAVATLIHHVGVL